ncbi:glycerate kinase [Desulforamulus aeronauticus]|uniref:Glycerate kinase n=1 Tax=Desulforamulus aeronauticus DSM 10349 TaxID=1121421 RepID=A0A1M6WQQ2_9FIRM|nr:glycerate kinase [Desulforamulus aeronauticus]SHK95996.1 glycerate kinase [Desulforamulus aeronauticus DSM 10349]
MRIVLAPDSYKGSLSAVAVATAMEQGILSIWPQAAIKKVPIADGGEGTVAALVTATGGRIIYENVMGPLGETVEAYWGILGDHKTAVIEMAAASGLPLVPTEKRDPRIATTYGTGQLIKAALDQGIRTLIIGIGGSATNDGGAGMAQALGVKLLDEAGKELPLGGAALAKLATIDLSGIDPQVADATFLVACDVTNPLCGPQGASAVYGPQKGATPEMVTELDLALARYADIAKVATGKDVASYPGAGAAGGLGAGLLLFTKAELKPGVQIVLEAAGFEHLVKQADLVITGEGATDFQTSFGKAPVGVAKIAQQYQVPVICLSGGLGHGCEDILQQGVTAFMSIVPHPMSLKECMADAPNLLQAATARLCRLLSVGLQLGCSSEK